MASFEDEAVSRMMADDDRSADDSYDVNPLEIPTSDGAHAEKGRFNSDRSADDTGDSDE